MTVFVTVTGSEVCGTVEVTVLHTSFSQTVTVLVLGASVVTSQEFNIQMVTVFVTQEPSPSVGFGVTTVHLSVSQTVTVSVGGMPVGSQGRVSVIVEQLPE